MLDYKFKLFRIVQIVTITLNMCLFKVIAQDRLLDSVKIYSSLNLYKTLKFAKVIFDNSNSDKETAAACNYLGTAYYYNSIFDSAYYYYYKSLSIRSEIKDLNGIAASYHNLAVLYDRINIRNIALNYFRKSELYFKMTKDREGLANLYNSLGSFWLLRNQYNKALSYYKKSLLIQQELKNVQGSIMCNYNIAVVNEGMGNTLMAYHKYKQLYPEIIKSNITIMTAPILNRMAHLELNNFNKAVAYNTFVKSINYNRKHISDPLYLIESFKGIADYFNLIGSFDSARYYYNYSYNLAQNSSSTTDCIDLGNVLSDFYYKHQKFKEAFEWRKKTDLLSDSFNTNENAKQLNEIETFYNLKNKQDEITKLEIEKDDKELIIKFGAVLSVILFLFLCFIYYAYIKLKSKTNLVNETNNQVMRINLELHQKSEIINEQNKNITQSLEYGRIIQEALTTNEHEFKSIFPDSFVFFSPKDIVSGDFLWHAKVKHNDIDYVYWAVADCTGHGVPGAMMTILGYNILNEIIINKVLLEPHMILDELRLRVISALNHKPESNNREGMDIILCRMNINNMTLDFSGANISLFVITPNTIIEHKTDKQPIGFWPLQNPFKQYSLKLEANMYLIMTTDGFTDQFNHQSYKKFKKKRFLNLLKDTNEIGIFKTYISLKLAIAEWMGEGEQTDDILVIGINPSVNVFKTHPITNYALLVGQN